MRKLRGYITRNWWLIAAGMVLTAASVQTAYEQRGYWAIGGEYLILPILLIAEDLLRGTIGAITEIFGGEKDV
jgi:hypothetical protein